MIRVADYIADFIVKQGVTDVFMLAGTGSMYLDDGIAMNKNLHPVFVRNEATAPMMAEAYNRLSGKLGVVVITTGPAGANAVTGVVESWVDSGAVLVLSGQVQRNHTTYNAKVPGLRTFGTQELNIVEVVKSITKYAEMVNDPNKIRYHLEKAVKIARSGRPGPVWLDIPADVQGALVDENNLSGYDVDSQVGGDNQIDAQVSQIVSLLRSSKKPLLIAGQGVRVARAVATLSQLVERLNVPVMYSRLGRDLMPYSHKNNMGYGGILGSRFCYLIMAEADLVISLGSRLAVPFVGPNFDSFSPRAKVVMVDVDRAELTKPGEKIDLPVNADVGGVMTTLLERLTDVKLPDYSAWLQKCQQYKEMYSMNAADFRRNPIDMYYFISRLCTASEPNDVFVSDAGCSYYITGQVLTFERGQREITSGAYASMGLAIPLAIGCGVARKDSRVLVVTGDGSFETNIQELRTLAAQGLNIKLFVMNNGGFASIRNTQDRAFEGRYLGSVDSGLSFRKVADAFDLPYFLIERHEEIDEKISRIIGQRGPALVEVICDFNQKILEPLRAQSAWFEA